MERFDDGNILYRNNNLIFNVLNKVLCEVVGVLCMNILQVTHKIDLISHLSTTHELSAHLKCLSRFNKTE